MSWVLLAPTTLRIPTSLDLPAERAVARFMKFTQARPMARPATHDLPPNPEAGIKKAALGSRFLKDLDKIADQIAGIVVRQDATQYPEGGFGSIGFWRAHYFVFIICSLPRKNAPT